MDQFSSSIFFYSALLFSAALLILSKNRGKRLLPPGPPALLVIGNVFNAPSSFEWVTYARWAKEYESALIFLRVFGTGILVLSSREDAEELLEKRSSKYSTRPSIPMMDIIGNSEVVVPVMPYGAHWKNCRKLFHREVETKTALYRPQELAATRRLLKRLCDTDGRSVVSEIWKLWSSDVVLSLAYGIQVLPENDPFVKIADEASDSFALASHPEAFLVNVLPVLRHVPAWFPGAEFKRKAKEWRKSIYALVEVPFEIVKAQLASGRDVQPSIASRLIPALNTENSEVLEKDSIVLRDVLANVFAAGPDLAVAMETFLLAMLMFPSVAREAQDAIDRVISAANLPRFEDISDQKIPYLDALVREVLRWNPIAPLAMPHATTADDTYKGYFIPRGTTVVANVWSMLRDEKVYGSDTQIFNPKRFLDKEGRIDITVPYPEEPEDVRELITNYPHYLVYPDMAHEVLSIAVVSVLWAFNILKATNEKGEFLEPSGKYISGAVCAPEPFQCVFKPRSALTRKLIQESLDE
ncbi:hypothetical protein D9757_008940 [Collybiopsis confluens]|uniref:Cytochrome P450 n=1 Tax=Collybiopsis confluens TaxID=2823264 RepID=A0A8H5M5R5_9AGAR|nr:hypothetical protein D9757_008940 [Collybiopsis confluens]